MKIAIFYHIYQNNDWENVVAEQINKLIESDLIKNSNHFFIGVNGSKVLEIENAIIFKNYENDEDGTLKRLYDFCKMNPDYYVFYFHTKGMSYTLKEHGDKYLCIRDWRHLMEYFCIENWRYAVKKLENVDAVGVNLSNSFFNFFAGNFWWTKASYINTCNEIYLRRFDRLSREFFIGSGKGNLVSLYNSKQEGDLNHYEIRYPRYLYENFFIQK